MNANSGAGNNDFEEIESSDTTIAGRRGGSRKIVGEDGVSHSKKGTQGGLKMRLFRIYYWVGKERNTSMSTAIALITVMFIQVFDLLISPIMKLPFKGAFYWEISELFDVIRLYPLVIQSGGSQVYWFFMFFPLAVSLFYVFLLGMIDASLRANRGKSIQLLATLRMLQSMSALQYWVFLIPTIDFFISIYQCDSVTGYHKIDTSLKCWGAEHAFFCALFSMGLMLCVTLAVIIALLFNESRPSHTDSLTRLDTNQELYLAILRILLVVVSHFTADFPSFHWLALALHGFVCFNLVRAYNQFLPYYHVQVSITYGALCFAYLWLVINAVVIQALDGDTIQYKGQIIVICIGFILMWPTAKYMRNRRAREITIFKQQEKIKDDLELDQFVSIFNSYIAHQESDQEVLMMFLGFMFLHREECQSPNCPLKHNQTLYQPLTDATSKREVFPSKDKILHQHFINSIFLDFQRLHPNTLSAQHHTCYAHFLFYQMGNVHMALIELNLAGKAQHSSTIQQSFTIYKYKQLIEEHLWQKFKDAKAAASSIAQKQIQEAAANEIMMPGQGGTDQAQLAAYAALDVTIVITFENLYAKFEKCIEQSATDHIEFWSHLDSNMIDLNVINKLGINIINRTKKVMDFWATLIKINPSYPNALYLYGNYLQQIKNDWDQGEDFKQQYIQVKRLKQLEEYQNQFDIMFADDTAVIIMNGSKEQQGKIMKTNQGISKLFGYSMFEVQGHDVNILMPPILAQKHQFFLEGYFKNGKERILNSCLESFAMYRTGVIFPVHLVVKPVPSLRNDIQYIGMVKQADKDYEYIITDENGKIDSISEGVISLLKLPISFFKEHEIPIQIIVPQLCEIQKLRNVQPGDPQTATHFEMWTGQKDIKFIVPKNFSNAGGRSGGHFGNQGAQNNDGGNLREQAQKNNFDIQADGFDKDGDMEGKIPSEKRIDFIGLRSPESLKIVCSMFKNQDHKSQPAKYLENLRNHINYGTPDFERTIKVDIQNRTYGAGQELKVKVFKIFYNRKKKKPQDGRTNASVAIRVNGGSNGSDNSVTEAVPVDNKGMKEEDTLMHKHGLSTLQALNDESFFIKYLEIITQQLSSEHHKNDRNDDLLREVQVLRVNLERQKRARATGRVTTTEEWDRIEIDRMIMNLKDIQNHIALKNNSGDSKNYNPIAVAFAHRLAIFAKSQQMGNGPGSDRSRRPSARKVAQKAEEAGDELKINENNKNPANKELDQKGSQSTSRATSNVGTTQHQDSRNYRDVDSAMKSGITKKVGGGIAAGLGLGGGGGLGALGGLGGGGGVRKDFMADFFQKNIFSQTQAQPNINHNDFVRNLQNKFKATNNPVDTKKDDDFGSPLKDDINLDPEERSVKFVVDEGGSVTSDSKSLLSQLRILRNALYENYSPQSIMNLKYSAQFVMVVLVAMTIASFMFSQQKYDQLKENFQSVQSSQIRMQSVTGINTATRFCMLMNNGMVNRYRYSTTQDYLEKMRSDINGKAIELQHAQTNLSQTSYDFSADNKFIINSNNVTVFYNTLEEVGTSQKMNIWSAVMQLSINAFKIKDMDLSDFIPDHMSVWYILRNAMNNILLSVQGSTQGILEDTKILSNDNKRILLILLLVASGCMLASMLIIMPVVTKVHQDKDKLLSLFLQIDVDDVKEQLKRCREFFSTFNNDDKTMGAAAGEHEGDYDEGNEEDDDNIDAKSRKSGASRKSKASQGGEGTQKTESQPTQRIKDGKSAEEQALKQEKGAKADKFRRKNKKLKKYSTNYFMLLVQFFFVVSFLESYFLYQYFQSDNFLVRSLSMIKEAATITNRSFSNFLLYQIMIEIIATNGTATVFNQKSTDYITTYLDGFNLELEHFLQVHSENVGKHDDGFNEFFDSLVYKSVCTTIGDQFTSQEEKDGCTTYLGGILEKGLYSANLAYWDDMRQIRDAFFKSNRSAAYLKDQINDQGMINIEKLNEIYFARAYQALLDRQNESINVQFMNRNTEIVASFAVYLSLLILSYFIIWGRFVESMRHSLWVTKSMLAIIPIEVIEKVKVIKDFLMATSQAAVRSMKE